MTSNKVAVLGCGPAGLLAAHAVQIAGLSPDIFSVYKPSPIGGAQFLHRAIPGITDEEPDGKVYFVHVGTEMGYAQKVYGHPEAPTSWDAYRDGEHDVWNMRRAYARLWAGYEDKIIDGALDADKVEAISRSYPLTLSTVPLKAICGQRHEFTGQDVWITEEDRFTDENMIVYNGLSEAPWYRASRIFGVSGVEYPSEMAAVSLWPKSPVRITKPLKNNCTCHPEVTMLGRYGKWQKGELIHHAYEGALKAIGEKRDADAV